MLHAECIKLLGSVFPTLVITCTACSWPGQLKRTNIHEFVGSVEIKRSLTVHSCLAHVINLANIAFMEHVTKLAAVKNSQAIWEYDPSLPDNRVFGRGLDVITAVQTLAIKVS